MLITRRGYQINKKCLKKEELDKLNNELIVNPKLMPPFDIIENTPIKLIHETEKNIFIPRYYGIEKYGDIFNKDIYNSKIINCKFIGKLNDKQINIINDILPKIYKYYGGLISLPCGFGKTILSLYLISILQLKTIILVHKESLKEQWEIKIKEFLNNFSIGIIQQKNINVNTDIIIAMIPSIAKHNYDKQIFNDIGLLIIDECHHIASKEFSKCLYKIGANYTIGLSATPNRKDGLTKIIYWYLGPQLIYIKTRDNNNVMIYNIKYTTNDEKFKILLRKYKGKETINTIDMITNISLINDRNNLLLDIIKKLLEDNNRYIMVLSERINHLTYLKNNIDNYIKDNNLMIYTEYYRGASTKNERRNAENNDNIHVLFGSYQIASEGLDIPRLNTLLLATPKKDIEQCIGRIQRKNHLYNIPLVIDIIDEIKPFSNYFYKKKLIYNRNNYNIQEFFNNLNNKFNLDLLDNNNICFNNKL